MEPAQSNRRLPKYNWIFWTGVVLIILGSGVATFATFFLFFYLIPFWVFLTGVLLVWISGTRQKTKFIWTFAPVVVFLVFQLTWRWLHTAPPETFLIPKDYRGMVHIRFNKPCGTMPEEEDGRRLYRIDKTGVLLSQFSDKQGFIDQEYYLVDSSGRRWKLPKMDVRDFNEEWTTEKNPHEPSRAIVSVFHWGRVSSDGTLEFFICTYRQLEAYSNYPYQGKFDALEQKILASCH